MRVNPYFEGNLLKLLFIFSFWDQSLTKRITCLHLLSACDRAFTYSVLITLSSTGLQLKSTLNHSASLAFLFSNKYLTNNF